MAIELVTALLSIALVFLLITQLSILSSLRLLREKLELLLETGLLRKEARTIAQFESESSQHVRRIKYRARTKLDAFLDVRGKRYPCNVMDLSITGAQLEFGDSIPDVEISEVFPMAIHISENQDLTTGFRVVRITGTTGKVLGGSFMDLTLESKNLINQYIKSRIEEELLAKNLDTAERS